MTRPIAIPHSSRQQGAALAAKRVIDVVVAAAVLVAGAPLMAAVAVAVKVDSPGPVFFRQERVGQGGRRFRVWKFRSMVADADPALHRQFVKRLLTQASTVPEMYKLTDDPRVTRVGRFIRATSIDELPQLLNVLAGHMSLVGPRPEVPYALEDYEPWAWRRFEVLPGMTGLWQVSGRGELSPVDMLRLDVEYADRWSPGLDLRLLAKTVPAVLRKVGSA